MFQVYGVFTVDSVEYESERSPPAIVQWTVHQLHCINSTASLISSSSDSQTVSTGLVAGVSVLGIIVITLLVVIIIVIAIAVMLFEMLTKKLKNKERCFINIFS